jgi:hypothetical protein
MMIGGTVIDTQIALNDTLIEVWSDYSKTRLKVRVKPSAAAKCVQKDDSVFWSDKAVYWTPKNRYWRDFKLELVDSTMDLKKVINEAREKEVKELVKL